MPLLAVPGSASAALAPVDQAFTTPGRYEFTVPQGVTSLHVQALGGGGGGGGGGGNNDGRLSGAGGGGGSSGGAVSCTATVKGGDKLTVVVGNGGAGGEGGTGKYHNGKPGKDGSDSGVADMEHWRLLADARHGLPGRGGEASGTWESGYGGAGGASNRTHLVCQRSGRVLETGEAGTRGHDARINDPGQGGAGGYLSKYPKPCLFAGAGGGGGRGAGNSGGGDPHQRPSEPGRDGKSGCVVLTYTP
ncbi:glycine-rich domain-containing protein [Streptomyces sp. GS7]|uniref:glycine-rich domain-containing protein n=1 Tax=Streptomyces sp. GS7 TaxID=2692234 RepID=UPI003FA6CEA0